MVGDGTSCPRILFADDEITLHSLVRKFLSDQGYDVDCVADGCKAIELFRRVRHDAVIIDLMMPHMNGYEFLRELKSVDSRMMKRTIVLTGSSQDTWEWFDRESVGAFLMKPIDLALLLGELEKVIEHE